jgi:hypothetical protein
MDKQKRERLGFREQVRLFFGGRGKGWLELRKEILERGGNLDDVMTVLIWMLRDQGAELRGKGKGKEAYHA